MLIMQRFTRKITGIIIFSGIFVFLFGLQNEYVKCQPKSNEHWLSFNNNQAENKSVQITRLDSNNPLKFKIEIPGIYLSEIQYQNLKYNLLTLPEFSFINEAGHPMLPKITKLIAIPESCTRDDIELEIVSAEFAIFKDFQICPVPELVKNKSANGEIYFTEKYAQNPTAYSTNSFYPDELVKIEKAGFIRDQRAIWFSIHPIQYNPVTRELKVYHKIEVSLNYGEGQVLTEKELGPYEELKQELFLNFGTNNFQEKRFYNAGKVTYPTNLLDLSNEADYLIITTDELISNSSLDSLAHHRAEFSGFDVAVVKTEDIYQQFPDTANYLSIKNFLIHVYSFWQAPHFGDGHLGYVLLIGEGINNGVNEIPSYKDPPGYGIRTASDYWYSCVNDDNGNGKVDDYDDIADLIIGRFSVGDHYELNTIARKTIHYEKNLNANEPWKKKVSMVSGFGVDDFNRGIKDLFVQLKELGSGQNFYEITEELIRSEMEPDFVRTSFVQAINDGRAIINIQAHGGVDNWGDSQGWLLFISPDMSKLSNQSKLPVMLSFSCNTAKFFDPEKDCLGEIFLNEPGKGAIAFIGSTESVGFQENIELNQVLFENILMRPHLSLGVNFYFANILKKPFSSYNFLGDPALSLARKAQHDLADLSVVSKDVDVVWSPFAGASETIKAKVYNFGFQEARNVIVQFFDGDPQKGGQQIGEDQVIDVIQSLGGSGVAQVSIDDVVSGELSIFVKVDPFNDIPEIEENNNTALLLALEPLFLDIASVAGVSQTTNGAKACFGDFDSDGFLDIYVINWKQPDKLFQNNGDGSFKNIAAQTGLRDMDELWTTAVIDYDNDGSLDIFIRERDYNIVYRNSGDGTFTSEIVRNNEGNPLKDIVMGFLDYDNDGFLDLFCLRYNEKLNSLYRNNGNGKFTDVTVIAGLELVWGGSNAVFADYNNDGDVDIYVLGFGPSNVLYQNNGNATFTNVTDIAGVKDDISTAGWAAFGDYDNDNDMDLFVYHSNVSCSFFQNRGDGTFSLADSTLGVEFTQNIVFGGTFLDYDNDGFLDILANSQPIEFFKNNSGRTFSKEKSVIQPIDLSNIYYWSTSIGDYDNNGNLDLYRIIISCMEFNNVRETKPNSILYRNKGADNNWLIVKLKGVQSNSFGIGARVRVVSANLSQIRDILYNFDGMLQSDIPVEFGLGKNTQIDTVEVRWPSGTVDVLTSVKVNTILTITEGIGDVSVPESYHLSQNFPNPFNQFTTIKYIVGGDSHAPQKSQHVGITIYNLIGQRIKTLIDEQKEPGNYAVTWDGRDTGGQQVATGVYFYQMKAGEYLKMKKMILLR